MKDLGSASKSRSQELNVKSWGGSVPESTQNQFFWITASLSRCPAIWPKGLGELLSGVGPAGFRLGLIVPRLILY